MGLLSGLLSLLGCKQKESSASVAYYPNDHKLSGQERKNFTNKFLKQKNVPVLEHLPLVEDYEEARFRDEKEVARKAVVLSGLLYVAHGGKTSEEVIDYFKRYNLWDSVSPDEQAYLENKNRTERDNIPITWRAEALNVLLWSLGHFDKLSFPTTLCDFTNYKNLPNVDADPTDWINEVRLRNTEDILNETDLIYRMHWATTDASLNGRPTPAGLSDDIIVERHFALNWLTMYADEWDDVTTDT